MTCCPQTFSSRLLFSFQRPAFYPRSVRAEDNSIESPSACQGLFLFFFPAVPPSTPPRPRARLSTTGAGYNGLDRPCQDLSVQQRARKTKASSNFEEASSNKFRRRPTFPHSYPCSIIGAAGLNFCVRDGNRCDPCAIATENRKLVFNCLRLLRYASSFWHLAQYEGRGEANLAPSLRKTFYGQASRSISTG